MASSIPRLIHASHYVSPDAIEEMEALANIFPVKPPKRSSGSLQTPALVSQVARAQNSS
jgi:hypothetical protein